jgi:pentatricopeptide repeat protein
MGTFTVGHMLYYQREYGEAIEQWKQVLRIEPNYPAALHMLACAYTKKSMMEEALGMVTKWKEEVGDIPDFPGLAKGLVACAYVNAGRVEEAKGMFRETEAEGLSSETSPVLFAYWYTCLGNIDLAFEFLEKAYEARDWNMFDIKVDPLLDPLRSDPRFAVILQKYRLA